MPINLLPNGRRFGFIISGTSLDPGRVPKRYDVVVDVVVVVVVVVDDWVVVTVFEKCLRLS